VTPIRPALAGGAQAFLADVAMGLAERGHEVALYCAAGSDVPGVEMVQIAVSPDVRRALVMPGRPSPAGEAVPELRNAFEWVFEELRRRRPDAVSQHAFDAEAIELCAGLPAVHTLHLPPFVPAVVNAVRGVPGFYVTVSQACRDAWLAAGAASVGVIRNGVPAWRPDLAPPARVTALMAGRLSPEKGFEDGVRAARRAGLEPLIVGGAYDPAYRPDVAEATLLPEQPRRRLWEVMAACAVTLVPARWEEPFGLVAAEAQMAGCPVAGYRRGGLPEVVEEGVSGFLVDPDDVEALADAARRALDLPRRQVHDSALRRLDLKHALDAHEAALREVAA
jgi:glycosyltransferase involved in cell wall biosynthesis